MKHYIYHDLDSGPLSAPLSLLKDVPLTPYPAEFIVKVCKGHTIAFTGSLRGLQLILRNPNTFDIVNNNPENKVYDFRYRLDVLSDLVSSLNGDHNDY